MWLLLSDKCFEVHSFKIGVVSFVIEIVTVVFNFLINPEQIQILIQARNHKYVWLLHMEEYCCLTCLTHGSECTFVLSNLCEDRNIKFDIMKIIFI
jgi:hypothetical protein